ncbi:hypothetical protein N4R57_06650 [Rhodobacteraceae bacterium D3-12]|nr:hypothetical protein N4R57_06650 [Rhodobacteraceae bacterium D3-12]
MTTSETLRPAVTPGHARTAPPRGGHFGNAAQTSQWHATSRFRLCHAAPCGAGMALPSYAKGGTA